MVRARVSFLFCLKSVTLRRRSTSGTFEGPSFDRKTWPHSRMNPLCIWARPMKQSAQFVQLCCLAVLVWITLEGHSYMAFPPRCFRCDLCVRNFISTPPPPPPPIFWADLFLHGVHFAIWWHKTNWDGWVKEGATLFHPCMCLFDGERG